MGGQSDSPYHGDYPNATRTFVFPNESKVADNGGIIYNATDLTYVNSFAGSFTDLDFSGDRSVVLRNNVLIGYSNTFLETGSYTLSGNPLRIFVNSDSVFSFYQGDTRGVFQVSTPLAALLPGTPGEPINPEFLAYTPDSIVSGEDGIIYLLSRANFSVFRWSVNDRKYLSTIPLIEAPTFIAYSSIFHALYLAYPGGKINRITPSESLTEVPFANLPQSPLGLATAGEFVFACDGSGAWATHYVFGSDGSLKSSEDWNYYSTEYIWSAANRRMYFFRDDTSPNDILSENIDLEGILGTMRESPYHDSTGFVHPIRLSPDGSVAVLGSGRIFDALNLTLINSLFNDISDADWLNTNLYTIHVSGVDTQVQAWSSAYAQTGTLQLIGNPLRLLAVGSKLEAITQINGYPRFNELDANLAILFQSSVPIPGPDPKIKISVSAAQVSEGGSATFQIVAPPNTRRPVAISYSMSGTASLGEDYTLGNGLPSNGQVVIPGGSDSASITVTTIADHISEKKETVTMTLVTGSGYTFAAKKKTAKLTIINVP
ncbi:MAG: hypothetical protein QOG48_481, partial [Verrucomicrobiota bacterium]